MQIRRIPLRRREEISRVLSMCTSYWRFAQLTTNKTHLAIFKYDDVVGAIDPPEKVLSKKFRNLKTLLLAHLKSARHITALDRRTANEKELHKSDRREKVVGKRIGRICYYMLKQGRPDTDFEHLVYLHSVNDSDIGDINHSNRFPAKFSRLYQTKLPEDWLDI